MADLVDVTVNGTGSGAGTYAADCFPPPGTPPPSYCSQPGGPGSGPYLNFGNYSFNQNNTALGSFSASGSADTNNLPNVEPTSVSSYADQNVTAAANSLNINLTGGYAVSSFFGFYSTEQDTISVGFDLTEASVLQLSGGIFPVNFNVVTVNNIGELVDSNGNPVLTLPVDAFTPVSRLLQPGIYYLDSSISATNSGAFGSSEGEVDFNLFLDASFTPVATPEPRGAIAGAMIGMILGGYAAVRRRVSA